MSRLVSGEDLMREWKIKEIELFDIVQNGLQPRNILGEPISPPDIAEKLDHLKSYENELNWLKIATKNANNKIESVTVINARNIRLKELPILIDELKHDLLQYDKYSWNKYELPKIIDEAHKLFNKLRGYLFSKSDVANYKKSIKDKLPVQVMAFLANQQLLEEVEMLYKAIKKANILNTSNVLREAAIKEYQDNKDKYKIINEKYLTDKKIYSFRTRKGREDFIGQILQKILVENNYPSCRRDFLFNEYKRQIDNISTKYD